MKFSFYYFLLNFYDLNKYTKLAITSNADDELLEEKNILYELNE